MASSADRNLSGEEVEEELSRKLRGIDPGNLPALASIIGRNYVTLKQFAILLDVTYQTPLRWIRQGKLKPVRVGKSWRIYEEEIRRFISSGTTLG